MISAGSPVRNVRTNETTDTPRMTRTAAASRRATYVRTSPFELQRIEPLRLVRTRRVVHPGAHPERGVGLVEEDERRLVSEKLLHVAVLRRALLRVVGGFDARQHLVEPGTLVVHAEPTLREPADHPRGLEIRVADAVDEEGRRLVLHPARSEGRELEHVELGLDSYLLQVARDRLGRLGMVGDAAGEAVELGLEAVGEARLSQEGLGPVRIVRIRLDARVVAERALVHYGRQPRAVAEVERPE